MTMLLEISRSANGKKIAYCLPSGEFLFATCDAAAQFSALTAEHLFGKNLFSYLHAQDAEKLDFCLRTYHAQCAAAAKDKSTSKAVASRPPQVIRVLSSGITLFARCITIPCTLRLLRCMDAVRMLNPVHLFVDASSFIIDEDDYSSVIANDKYKVHDRSELMASSSADKCDEVRDSQWDAPVEFKPQTKAAAVEAVTTTTTASCPAEESLADYAFEADWSSEIVPHSCTPNTDYRAALVM